MALRFLFSAPTRVTTAPGHQSALHTDDRTPGAGNPRLLARLCASGGLAYCSYTMCRSPVLPLFAHQLGAAPGLVGFVVAASTITGVFVKLPTGALSDQLGRRTLLLAAGVVFACLPFAYLTVAGLASLVIVRFVHGSATAMFGPVVSATVSDLAPVDRRGRWLGTYAASQGAGTALAPVIAGSLMVAGDFDPAFVASGLVGIAALGALAGLPDSRPRRDHAGGSARALDGIRDVLSSRLILTASAAQAGQFFVNGSLNAFLPLYANEALGLTTAEIGVLFGVQTVSTLLSRPLFGELSDRAGRRPVIFAGLVTCATAVCAVSFAASFAVLCGTSALYGAGVAVTSSAASAYVTDLAHRMRYGAAHGVFGTIYDIGDAAGPLLGGLLVGVFGYRTTFRLVAAIAMVVAVAFVLLTRKDGGTG